MSASRAGMAVARRTLAEALANPEIRAIEVAWTIRVAADTALLVVGLLVAYELGGAWGVGLLGVARTLPATAVALIVDTGASARPERVLVIVNLVQAACAAFAAATIALGAPLLALAAVCAAAAVGSLIRSTQFSLFPAIAVTPSQLVSANVVASLGESLGTVAGPLIAGYLTAAAGPAPAALVAAVAFVGAAAAVTRVRVADAARPSPQERVRGIPVVLGLRSLAARPPAAAVMAGFGLQLFVRGSLTTLLVLLALEVLRSDQGTVGLLNGVVGVGGIAGAVVGLWLANRSSLAPVHAVALAAWGLPIAVVGLAPTLAVAVTGMLVVGLANALLDVAGFTLLQRGIPNRSRAAVFAVLEAMAGVMTSLGAVAAAVLVEVVAGGGALLIAGLLLPIAAVVGWPRTSRLDREGVVDEARARLLRGIPPFALLPLSGLERLAGGMTRAHFAAGTALMTEGEPGDRYFVIERGTVAVTVGGRELRRQGPGEGCGEIALLRRVPRTATVRALEPVEAWAIDLGTFLAAVGGHAGSRALAEEIAAARIDASRPSGT